MVVTARSEHRRWASISLLPEAADGALRDLVAELRCHPRTVAAVRGFSSRLGSGGWDRNGGTGLGDAGRGAIRRRCVGACGLRA
eukprot:2717516-Rhodomonas_salina.1